MKNKQELTQTLSENLEMVDEGMLQQAFETDTAEKFQALNSKPETARFAKKGRPVTTVHRVAAIAACLAVALGIAFSGIALAGYLPGFWGSTPTDPPPMTQPPGTTQTEPAEPREPNIPVGEVSFGLASSDTCYCGNCLELKKPWVLHSSADAAKAMENGIDVNCRLYDTLYYTSLNHDFFTDRTMVFVFFAAPTHGHNYTLTGMEKLADGSYVIDVQHTEDMSCVVIEELHYIRIEVNGVMEEDAVIHVRVDDVLMQDITITSGIENRIDDPIACMLWTELQENNWLRSEGGGAYGYLAEAHPATLPLLLLDGDVSVYLGSYGTLNGAAVYYQTENGEYVPKEDFPGTVDALSDLPAGNWYVSISVTWEGSFVGSENRYELHCYEHLFQLKVPQAPIGTCGENATWEFNTDTGILTISGSGEMDVDLEHIPWGDYRESITKLVVEPGITTVDGFVNCYYLTDVSLPETLQIITANAFGHCSALTQITIPDSVTHIQDEAFSYCSKLEKVSIGTGLSQLSQSAFLLSERLQQLTIHADNPNFFCDGAVIYTKHPRTAVLMAPGFTGEYTVLPETTEIGASAFHSCRKLTSVILPNSVTCIGQNAFRDCRQLEQVHLSENLQIISEQAFRSCYVLTELTIPANVTTIQESVFVNCEKLTKIVLLGDAPEIHEIAFSSVTAVVTYPADNPTWTADKRTNYGGNLIWVPDDPNHDPIGPSGSCGENANWFFDATTGTLTISGSGEMDEIETAPWWDYGMLITQIVIEHGITKIDGFSELRQLVSVEIPDSVTTIGERAFYQCPLTSIHLPDSVTTIGDEAFMACSLTSILLPNSVTTIGKSAFYGCSALKEINIPVSLTEISPSMLNGCSNLRTISLHDGITTIGNQAFFWCVRLESIVLPNSVTYLGTNVFAGCSNLQSVTLSENITTIPASAFSKCTSLKEIHIPDSVTSIARGAFINCSSLSSIVIPNSVTHIEGSAFSGCNSLTSIHFAGDLPELGIEIFSENPNHFVTIYYPADNKTWTQEAIDEIIDIYHPQLQFVAVDKNGQPVNP